MDELEGQNYLSLATFRKTGVAVPTPVWFARHDGAWFVFSARDAGKMKRLRNSDRAQVAACDVRGKLLGDWLDARATVVEDEDTIRRAYDAFHAKYGWQIRLTDFFSKLTGRYDERAMIRVERA